MMRPSPRDRLPDFLCIGAQRSGTTLLDQALRHHPDIYLPPCKELHALDAMAGIEPERWHQYRLAFLATVRARGWRAWHRIAWAKRFALSDTIDMDWYASLFREARPGQCVGEITPAYALLPSPAIAAAVAWMPDLRVFFVMRDPVDRALSGAIHACTLAIGATRRPDMSALLTALRDPGCIARSRYRATIERWSEHVPADRFHVLLFDDLVAEPEASLEQIHATLGVRHRPMPHRWGARVNANQIRVDWPREAIAEVARQVVGDCEWLAERYGGATHRWAERARQLAHDAVT